MPVMRKVTAHTSTRRRSSARCSTRVIESGWGRASLRRFSEMAMGLEFEPFRGRPQDRSGQFIPGSSGTVPPEERTWWTMPPGSVISTPGMPGGSSEACTVPAGRLGPADGWTASPCTSGGSEPLAVPDVAPFSALWVSARVSRKDSGDRTAWVMVSVEGRSGKVPRTSDSSRSRNLRKSPHSAPDLPGHLGQLVGSEDDEGHHQDDQQLRRAEEGHVPSVPAPGGGLRSRRPPPARPAHPGTGTGGPRPGGDRRGSARRGAHSTAARRAATTTATTDSTTIQAESLEGPHHEDHLAHDQAPRDGSEVPAVLGVGPVVPHHEVLAGGDGVGMVEAEGVGQGARRGAGAGLGSHGSASGFPSM